MKTKHQIVPVSFLNKTATPTLSRQDQLRIMIILKNPDISQTVRASRRSSYKKFWSQFFRHVRLAELQYS